MRSTSSYSIPEIVDKLIEGPLSSNFASQSATEYILYCPFHANNNTPAFYINKETGLWHCFNESCGAKGSLRKLCEKYDMDISGYTTLLEIPVSLADDIEDEIGWEIAMERISINYSNVDDVRRLRYLIDRGFAPSVLQSFEIGYSERQRRIVIPVRNELYRIVGFIGRAVDQTMKPKYLYSRKFPRAQILFNLNNAKHYPSVIVTEGSLDAMKVHQAGFPNVVATLGSQLTKHQAELLNINFNEIIIMTDDDEAGEGLKRAIIDSCPAKMLWMTHFPEGEKDPGGMGDMDIRKTIEEKVSFLDYLFYKENDK